MGSIINCPIIHRLIHYVNWILINKINNDVLTPSDFESDEHYSLEWRFSVANYEMNLSSAKKNKELLHILITYINNAYILLTLVRHVSHVYVLDLYWSLLIIILLNLVNVYSLCTTFSKYLLPDNYGIIFIKVYFYIRRFQEFLVNNFVCFFLGKFADHRYTYKRTSK